jgi:iron complex transport system ATP-binding protein
MRYDGVAVLGGVTLEFHAGEMVAVVGPNGAGKSTLVGIMAGLRTPYEGTCRYQDREIRAWPRRGLAREVSFVPQSLSLQFPFTAEQVVLMGRTPYCDGMFESPEDGEAVEEAMRTSDTLQFRARDFRTLSGGERQRVVLASALAQRPRVLLLDEPTTFLDLKHQLSIYALLRDLCRAGLLVIAVTHDLNLAATYSDRVVLLDAGRVAADAAPAAVVTAPVIRRTFGVEIEVRAGREGKPWVLYGG